MSSGQRTPVKNESRRNKRRHYTISGSHPFLEQHSPPKMPAGLRSRDDMDMERCLRTVNTPDIVRSTIKKSEVFDEQTIDMQADPAANLMHIVLYEDLGARGSVEALRSKVGEEKRRRAHLLALSHTIAKEVMERSKMVAGVRTYASPLAFLPFSFTLSFCPRSLSSTARRDTGWRAVMATLERLDPEVLRQEALQREREEQDSSPEQPLPLYQQRENYLT
ncbi:hypothetical protein HPB49_024949 [Dermacentor silvarum]|uniref:Uncharacterized protein n=1 Tax=Dermacentor silvarum TaxID=543639 RepID=A0ACB8D159_DERSI|nr:hypothetical protein HPB49_024949 [Dermacentor silvarum]